MNLWDGYGIADASYRNPNDAQYVRYATYKLAPLLIVAQRLNQTNSLSFHIQIVDTIWSMQAYNGGILTNYLGSAIPHGVVNTETTALAVMANPTPIPTPPPTPPPPPYMEILVVLVVAVLVLNVLILISTVRKRPQ